MNNRDKIKNVYDEIHASDALFRKVMSMNKKESKVRNVMKFASTAVAGLAIMIATSNGICYAATGESLSAKLKVLINGEQQEIEMDWKQDGDTTYGEYQMEVEDGDEVYVELVEDEDNMPKVDTDAEKETLGEKPEGAPELATKDGKVYLMVEDVQVDITQDFVDGTATGTVECASGTYTYTVTGTVDEFSIVLSN